MLKVIKQTNVNFFDIEKFLLLKHFQLLKHILHFDESIIIFY